MQCLVKPVFTYLSFYFILFCLNLFSTIFLIYYRFFLHSKHFDLPFCIKCHTNKLTLSYIENKLHSSYNLFMFTPDKILLSRLSATFRLWSAGHQLVPVELWQALFQGGICVLVPTSDDEDGRMIQSE